MRTFPSCRTCSGIHRAACAEVSEVPAPRHRSAATGNRSAAVIARLDIDGPAAPRPAVEFAQRRGGAERRAHRHRCIAVTPVSWEIGAVRQASCHRAAARHPSQPSLPRGSARRSRTCLRERTDRCSWREEVGPGNASYRSTLADAAPALPIASPARPAPNADTPRRPQPLRASARIPFFPAHRPKVDDAPRHPR